MQGMILSRLLLYEGGEGRGRGTSLLLTRGLEKKMFLAGSGTEKPAWDPLLPSTPTQRSWVPDNGHASWEQPVPKRALPSKMLYIKEKSMFMCDILGFGTLSQHDPIPHDLFKSQL